MTRQQAERAHGEWRAAQHALARRVDVGLALWVVCQATLAALLAWSLAPPGQRAAAWLLAGGSAAAVVWLAVHRRGAAATRHVASAAAMLLAALFAQLGGDRAAVHASAFATLALVALYRDPLAICTAVATIVADVGLRAAVLPARAFGGDGAPLANDRLGLFLLSGAALWASVRALGRATRRAARLAVERDDARGAAPPAAPRPPEPAAHAARGPLADAGAPIADDELPDTFAALVDAADAAALAAVAAKTTIAAAEHDADHDWQLAAVRRVHDRDRHAAAALTEAQRRLRAAPPPPATPPPDPLPARLGELARQLAAIAARHEMLALNADLAGARSAAPAPDLAAVVTEATLQAHRVRELQREFERLAAAAGAPRGDAPADDRRPSQVAAIDAAIDAALTALAANADDLSFAFGAEGTEPPAPAVPDDWPGHQLEVLVES